MNRHRSQRQRFHDRTIVTSSADGLVLDTVSLAPSELNAFTSMVVDHRHCARRSAGSYNQQARNSRDIGRVDHIRHARELAHVGPATTVCSGKHYTANGVEHDGTLERMDR